MLLVQHLLLGYVQDLDKDLCILQQCDRYRDIIRTQLNHSNTAQCQASLHQQGTGTLHQVYSTSQVCVCMNVYVMCVLVHVLAVYLYVCMYMCVHECVHVCLRVCMSMCVLVHMCSILLCVHVHVCASAHACSMFVCVHVHVHTYLCALLVHKYQNLGSHNFFFSFNCGNSIF